MAVFTALDEWDIQGILARYDLGLLLSFYPISSGIENTNYFVDTLLEGRKRTWVLTLFENLHDSELPYFVELTQQLAVSGLRVPAAIADRSGVSIFRVGAKSGVLVPKFPGRALIRPRSQHVARIGQWLAHMHQAASASSLCREPDRNCSWFATRTAQLLPHVSADDQQLLHVLNAHLDAWTAQIEFCPKGLIHGDLFRDNVLFQHGVISGVIDFYHSCQAPLVLDLAIAINDWGHADIFVQSYQSVRRLKPIERESLPVARIMAAWSFWLSRLMTKHLSGYQGMACAGVVVKDPDPLKRLVKSLLPDDIVRSVMKSV